MKPRRRFTRVLLAPGIPRIDRLRLAIHETSAIGADVLFLEVAEHRVKTAVARTRHELSVNDGTIVALEILDALPDILNGIVTVERNDVRFFKLATFCWRDLGGVGP